MWDVARAHALAGAAAPIVYIVEAGSGSCQVCGETGLKSFMSKLFTKMFMVGAYSCTSLGFFSRAFWRRFSSRGARNRGQKRLLFEGHFISTAISVAVAARLGLDVVPLPAVELSVPARAQPRQAKVATWATEMTAPIGFRAVSACF